MLMTPFDYNIGGDAAAQSHQQNFIQLINYDIIA